MTVDIEDYFHVSAFESVISASEWSDISPRVGNNTHRLIDLFNEHNIKATFFTLGWVADHCPDVVKRIVDEGHELCSHGSNHRRITTMTLDEAFEDIRVSKDKLEQISGEAVLGYRAPSFSVDNTNEWVFDILVELGFKYSSSTYPVKHDLYGVPEWPRFKHMRKEGILEIPVSTVIDAGKNKGIGGGYFRLYPYWFSNRRINKYMKNTSEPYNFYFHPWEIDSDQPRVKGASFKSFLRHYVNLHVMEKKLDRLMKDYDWGTMYETYKDAIDGKSPL
jgi:polysaccharide deacetylase family protein (PEP-CTERM system associated)